MAELIREEEEVLTGPSLTRSDLVDRFGPAGDELFERIDRSFRSGDVVYCASVRTARETLSNARTPGRARVVVPARSSGGDEADEGMLMIALSDFEAVVKAAQPEMDWLAEFAPRAGLEAARSRPVVPRGQAGHRMYKP